MIGQQRDRLDRLRMRQQARRAAAKWSGQVSPVSGASRRRSGEPSVPARRWRPARSDRAVVRRHDWRECRSGRRHRAPAPRPASEIACFVANGSASVAVRVMISMPKPGSMVSILSQSSRVRRFASRSGMRRADADRPGRDCRRDGQRRSSRRAPRPLASSSVAELGRRACRYSGRSSRPRRSARRRRGGPRSAPAAG